MKFIYVLLYAAAILLSSEKHNSAKEVCERVSKNITINEETPALAQTTFAKEEAKKLVVVPATKEAEAMQTAGENLVNLRTLPMILVIE